MHRIIGTVIGQRATENAPPERSYIDLVASTFDVTRDLTNNTVTFSLNIYNAGNLAVTTPFRVEISVTRQKIFGEILANSVALLQINDYIPPNSYFKTPGNTDPFFDFDETNIQYIVEALIDPDFELPDTNRNNNSIWVKWFRSKDWGEATSKLPLIIKHEFKNNKWERID